jgi:hypothetical protein
LRIFYNTSGKRKCGNLKIRIFILLLLLLSYEGSYLKSCNIPYDLCPYRISSYDFIASYYGQPCALEEMKLIRIWRDCGQIVGCIRQRISNFPQRAY